MNAKEPVDVAALRAKLDAATPGPWSARLGRLGDGSPRSEECQIANALVGALIVTQDGSDEGRANVDLIVALRNAAPALLDEVERLRAAATVNAPIGASPSWSAREREAARIAALEAALTDVLDGFEDVGGNLSVNHTDTTTVDAARSVLAGKAGA